MNLFPGWSTLPKDTQTALIMAGATTASGIMNAMYENKQADEDRQASAITNQAEGQRAVLGSETGDYEYKTGRDDTNARNAANMAGTSPLQHQAQRARMAATGAFLGGAGQSPLSGPAAQTGLREGVARHMPQGGTSASALPASVMAYFTPGALAGAEQNYWDAQNNIDPRVKGPDLGAVGYGGAGTAVSNTLNTNRDQRLADRKTENDTYNEKADARRAALLAALDELGPDSGAEEAAGNGGGTDWKKWGGLAAGLGAAYLGGRYA